MNAKTPIKLNKNLRSVTYYKKRLALPIVLLSLASLVVVQMTPLLVQPDASIQQPALWQTSVIGVAVIIFSALFLAYAAKLIGLARGWLVLGVLFSTLIVILKFILVPRALYSQTYEIGSGLTAFDPNSSTGYIGVAVTLFFLYVFILWAAYKYYDKKVALKLMSERRKMFNYRRAVSIVVVVIVLLLLLGVAYGSSVLLLIPLIGFGPTAEYVNAAFTGGGLPLVVSTILAILFSVKYLEHASNSAINAKDGTILAITFWIGLSLLLLYHVLWVIYMTVMLTVWPFKTISPSGK